MKILQRTSVHCEEHIAEINGKKILFRRIVTIGFGGKGDVRIVIRAISLRTNRDIHVFESTRPLDHDDYFGMGWPNPDDQ